MNGFGFLSLDFSDKKKAACACLPKYARWSYALLYELPPFLRRQQ